MRHRRTRSGRVCRPPQYMVKDYKQIPTVDFEVEPADETGSGNSESSGDEANNDAERMAKKAGGVFDVEEEAIPTGELDC